MHPVIAMIILFAFFCGVVFGIMLWMGYEWAKIRAVFTVIACVFAFYVAFVLLALWRDNV